MQSRQTTAPATMPIVPFWRRLREIWLYPLRGDALLTIAVLTVCRFAAWLPLGWFFDLLIWAALYKYAFQVLRESADGNLDPPVGGLKVDESLGWSAIGLQIGFVLIGFFAFWQFGPAVGMLCMIVLALGQPGAMMSLAIDQNALHALNPLTWLRIMGRLGGPYFLVVGLDLVVDQSRTNVLRLLALILPGWLTLLAAYFLAHYVTIAMFHLMGYLIYQYHEKLGYEPAPLPAARPDPRADPDQDLLDAAAQRVREGQPAAAADLLRERLDRGASDTVHGQYRKLLRLMDDKATLLRHGHRWLGVLLAQEKYKRAVDLADECLRLDPAFALEDAQQITQLARQAAALDRPTLAVRLLSGFHRRFPKHRDIAPNYLLAARLMHEHLGQDAQARQLLLQLKRAYPGHALEAQIDTLLAAVERMLAAAAPGNRA